MAGEIGQVFVRVRPNMTAFEAETLAGVKKTFKRAAEIAGVAYGATAAVEFAKHSVEDAAAVQKSQELVRAEFGKSGNAIKKWADDAGIHLGVAGHETLSVAGRFGILFKNLGIGQKQAADMTLNMEKLGGSLAAIRGVDPGPILERLPVAMAGNIRGLKQLGVAIDAQLIKQTALELGFGKQVNATEKNRLASDALAIAQARLTAARSKYAENDVRVVTAQDAVIRAQDKVNAGVKTTLSALTPAQRAMVIYTIATQHLADWQKQAAAHSGDFANVSRRLSAEWDHAKEVLGARLLPILTRYGDELAKWLDRMDKSGKLQKDVNGIVQTAVGIFKAVAAAVKTAYDVFKLFADAVGGTTRAVKLLIAAFLGFKLAQLIVSMEALATKIGLVGSASAVAAGKAGVGGLISKIGLLRTSVAAPIIIAVGLKYFIDKNGLKNVYNSFGSLGTGTLGPPIASDVLRGNNPYPVDSPAYFAWARSHGGMPLGVTGTGGPREQPGSTRPGSSISGPGDFRDESNAFKNALMALAKSVGAIRLDSGYRSDAHQAQLWDASVAAGHPGFMSNGNPIARPASRGGAGSPHSRGVAADGTINYRGRIIPLSALPASLLARYGLTTVAGDVGHIQLAGQTVPIDTSGTGGTGGGGGLIVGANPVVNMTKAQLENAKASLTATYKAIAATAANLGVEMTTKIQKDMKAARAAIGDVSNADTIAKARQGLANLRAEVQSHLQLLRTRIALMGTFDGIKAQIKKMGEDVTPAITAQMAKIRAEIVKAVTPTEIAKVKSQMTALKAAITTQIALIKQQAADMTTTFNNAWSRLASGADTAFDRVTQKALTAFQTTVNVAGQSFLFGGSITQTPAEKALADIAAQQQAASDTKGIESAQDTLTKAQAALEALKAPTADALTAAQAAYDKLAAELTVAQQKLDTMTVNATGTVTAAQLALQQANVNVITSNLDTAGQKLADLANPTPGALDAAQQAVLDAQAGLDAAMLQQKQTALQAQAVIERTAATKQLNDAQTAYQEQRDLLKTAMDDRVAAIETGMMNGTIAAADGMKQLSEIFADPQYGITAETSGLVIGGAFYSGLNVGLSKVMELFDKLAAKMKRVGLLPGGDIAPPASGAGGNSGLFAGLSQSQAFMVSQASDPQALADALRAANQGIIDELKKQTALAQDTNSTSMPGSRIAQEVAR